MSEEKDNRVDFEFVRDAIENQDQEKMEIEGLHSLDEGIG